MKTTRLSTYYLVILLQVLYLFGFVSSFAVVPPSSSFPRSSSSSSSSSSALFSLKPAAIPLMDSGKALARSGELLIDLTTAIDLYGGALSAAGAQIRNAGDSIAQAAASCRFKTATELVCDELRESATCLQEGAAKLQLAVQEAGVDDLPQLAQRIDPAVKLVEACSVALEAAGAGIMQREKVEAIGANLVVAGECLQQISPLITSLDDDKQESKDAGQRMAFAAEKMVQAGNELQGIKPKPKGKSWLKGG